MDDLISRAYVLAEYDRQHKGPPGGARKIMEEAPAVDAVPVVHGRWVKMTGMMPPEYHGHYCCSECEWHMKGLRNSWTREEDLLYCPNCGAKMDATGRDKEATPWEK